MQAFKRILVPVDFAECSKIGLELAASLAKAFGASIDVLHVWATPAYVSPAMAVSLGAGRDEVLQQYAERELARQMERFIADARIPEDLEVKTRITYGIAEDAILRVSKDYDLIVIGTHGRKGLSHLLLGSVTAKVLRRAERPVFVVQQRMDSAAIDVQLALPMIRKILVPVDFSAASRVALELAIGLAERSKAMIVALHVWQSPAYVTSSMLLASPGGSALSVDSFIESEASAALVDFIAPYQRGNVRLESRLDQGNPSERIGDIAKGDAYDLIVMGAHGRTGFNRWVMGSVAEHVVRTAPCPVLVVRKPASHGNGTEGQGQP